MKKKSLLFSFISVIIVVSVILLLVLMSKSKNRDEDNNPNDTPSQFEETIGDNETNEETKEYATYFAVNLPNTINVFLNSTINLKSNYLNISPANMLDDVKIEITENDMTTTKISLNNNILTASEVGSYKIKFSVPSSETTEFSKTITVNVYNDIEVAHINLVSNSIIIDEVLDISNLFTIQTDTTYTVATDDKLTFYNNTFTANAIGESIVKFTFTEGNIEYNYQFKIYVTDIPEYEIVLNNVTDNTIEIEVGKAFYINYIVINRNEGDISQEILAESNNIEVITIESIKNPLIKIKATSTGEATILLTYALDTSIKLELTVIVK